MSKIISMNEYSAIWNEKTILENGMEFLSQKNKELKRYQKIWNASLSWSASLETSMYNIFSKTPVQRFKDNAEKSRMTLKY
jgi:hypothetical protein